MRQGQQHCVFDFKLAHKFISLQSLFHLKADFLMMAMLIKHQLKADWLMMAMLFKRQLISLFGHVFQTLPKSWLADDRNVFKCHLKADWLTTTMLSIVHLKNNSHGGHGCWNPAKLANNTYAIQTTAKKLADSQPCFFFFYLIIPKIHPLTI